MATQAEVQTLADQVTAQTAELGAAVTAIGDEVAKLKAEVAGGTVNLAPLSAAVAAAQTQVDAIKGLAPPTTPPVAPPA